MGLCSTQAKVDGFMLKAALCSLDRDYIFFPISWEGFFSGTPTDINERIKNWLLRRSISSIGTLLVEHGGAPFQGTLREI